jgi:hypothetical protein
MSTTDSRTQRGRLLALLIRARGEGWVPLTEILDLKISQFGSRLWELRHTLNFRIENRMETTADGRKLSWYRLRPGPTSTPGPTSLAPADSLFPDLDFRRNEVHRDDG